MTADCGFRSHALAIFGLRGEREQIMAKNGAHGNGRIGATSDRHQMQGPMPGKWVKRDASTGRFMATKNAGGSFKGVRRER